MLEVTGLHAYYGKSHILHGVDAHVDQGEIVALLGRNGVGRSTMAKAILGMVKAEGPVKFGVRNARAPHVRDRACGDRLRARESRHLPDADRAAEPDPRREA
jgi:ABC-type branched-subunit amino acid transport system ATPase component